MTNFSQSELYASSKNAISELSKANDAFIRALQNDTPPCSIPPPTPSVEDVVAAMTKAAEAVLNDDKKAMLDSKRWSSRGELHQEIVQDTVLALENYTR